ncbi:MAG: FAD binding domain-containing protein, partial [Alphaproteobacteria bacterium]|nr:FAD binding domain-containing protein [Alphaproteobacteria bacterium]
MYNFNFHAATSLDDAVAKLGAAEDGTLMAGGQTLIPVLKQRLASPSDVVDLSGISELSGISAGGDGVTIGA